MSSINRRKLQMPVLNSLSDMCLQYDFEKRPNTNDISTFVRNL